MTAKEILRLFIYDARLAEASGTFAYLNDEKGNTNYELIDRMFGECANIVGTLNDGVDYLYQYSDAYQPLGKMPDAIVVLQENGRCVFLWAIE